jgi:hypothetical protein
LYNKLLKKSERLLININAFLQISAPKEAFRKTWSAKYTLRSHFDGVRALEFHPTEPVLITASEDQVSVFTLKERFLILTSRNKLFISFFLDT